MYWIIEWSTNFVVANRMETIFIIPIWIWNWTLDSSCSMISLFHTNKMWTIMPSTKKDNMSSFTNNSISWLQFSFADISCNLFQGRCCFGCSKIPRHRNKSRTISSISINLSNIISNVSIDPVLTSWNDGWSCDASIWFWDGVRSWA